jgi:hypothetical protein
MTKAARKPHPPVTMEDTCNYADAQRAGGEEDDTFPAMRISFSRSQSKKAR